MAIKVSAIIPVYNAELYLAECLESILQQTFEDFEVICIDDGSSDGSLDILFNFQEKDSRIRILTQDNQGAGVARNLGISCSMGDYLFFLDADDFFAEDMFCRTVEHAEKTGADIVLFGGNRFDTRKSKLGNFEFLNTSLLPQKECFSKEDLPHNLFQLINPAPWTKLFRRDFVSRNGLLFQALKNSNDVFFTFASLALARSISAIEAPFVHYRVGNSSSTQSGKDSEPTCVFEAYYALFDHLKRNNLFDELSITFCKAVISSCTYVLETLKSDEARDKILDELISKKFDALGIWDVADEMLNNGTMAKRAFLRAAASQYHKRKALAQNEGSDVPYKIVLPYRGPVSPDISIIIPVFNTACYVDEAINSILSYENIAVEVVCINDGSSDSSLEILIARGKNDQRVVVVDKENGGPSETRNLGLKLAQGRFVLLLDSDDYLKPYSLSTLVNMMDAMSLDTLFFSADTIFDSPDHESSFCNFSNRYQRHNSYEGVFSGPELFEKMWNNGEYYSSACMFAMRRNFLLENNILFVPGILHEDNAFTFTCILASRKSACILDRFYMRRIRSDSIMTTAVSFANSYGYYICHVDMNRTYYLAEGSLSSTQQSAAREVVASMLAASRRSYINMPSSDVGAEYGIGLDYRAFCRLVKNDAMKTRSLMNKENSSKAELTKLRKKLSSKTKELKKIKASRSYRMIGRASKLVLRAKRLATRLGRS